MNVFILNERLRRFIIVFIVYLLIKYLLNNYYKLDVVLGIENILVMEIEKYSVLW